MGVIDLDLVSEPALLAACFSIILHGTVFFVIFAPLILDFLLEVLDLGDKALVLFLFDHARSVLTHRKFGYKDEIISRVVFLHRLLLFLRLICVAQASDFS